MSDNVTIIPSTTTAIVIPAPTATSTVILVGGGPEPYPPVSWSFPIIFGVIIIITMIFILRAGWNIGRDKK